MERPKAPNFLVTFELSDGISPEELEQVLLDMNARRVHSALWVLSSKRTANALGIEIRGSVASTDFVHLLIFRLKEPFFSRGGRIPLVSLVSDLALEPGSDKVDGPASYRP